MSVSCAFASDNAAVADANYDVSSHVDNVTVSGTFGADSSVDSNVNVDVQSASDVNNVTGPGSYDDLNNDIQKINSGETYNFTKDYKFEGKGQTIILQDRVIVIKQNNIIINGNGHTIDAGGLQNFAIFKILGNNVTIKDLKFINSEPGCLKGPTLYGNTHYEKVLSPISWIGSNGVMQGCVFINDKSVNGGAVTWMGEKGRIDNCIFINNTAKGAGGALYIGGTDTKVSNCQFINSSSQLSGEAVYIDRNRKNIQFINNTIVNSYQIIDGAASNIDVDYLYYTHMVNVYGNLSTSQAYRLNIIPLIYQALMKGGMNSMDDIFKYYVQYDNKTGSFTLNIAAYQDMTDASGFHGAFDYLKSICFTNVTDFNQVFEAAIHGNYECDITQVIIGYVSNQEDYNRIITAEAFGTWFNTDKDVRKLSNGLKVIFTAPLTINSAGTWEPKRMGYNTIMIVGNGSTIKGGAGDRDEKKWLVLDDDVTFIADNFTIKNFNTAIECLKGKCYLNNMIFEGNRMDYMIERDWGAAILNTGVVICNNCTFKDNYAKYGGAIFNQGYLSLDNCTFQGNTAYGEKDDVHVGDNVCIGDGGHIEIDGVNVTANNNIVYFAESISKSTSTWMTVVSVAGSFAIGFIAGVITANPVAGIAIGFAVGAAIGTFTASEIIASNYDVNFNRLTTCLFVIGGSALAGAAGGFVGYLASGAAFAEAQPVEEGIPWHDEFSEASEGSVIAF